MKESDILDTLKNIEFNDEIIEIEELDNKELLDIEVSDNHLFFVNGILTKNSYGVPATADLMGILGTDIEKMVYENEVHYKWVKNRLGGMSQQFGLLYFDARSLKMYDQSEESLWFEEAKETEDERKVRENGR